MVVLKFRGLDARTKVARWGLLAVAAGIVLGATGPSAIRALLIVWDTNRANLPWIVERSFAFLAYGAVAGSVIYGLLLSTKVLDGIAHRPITFALHRDLAAFGVAFAAVHGMLMALDRSVPFDLAQIALPGLAPYAPIWVAAGQLTFYVLAAVLLSFYIRRRIGQRAWRLFHYLTFVAFVGATAHGLGAGTDSGAIWARWLYIGAAVAVTFLFTYRIVASLGSRLVGPRRPGPSRLGDLLSR